MSGLFNPFRNALTLSLFAVALMLIGCRSPRMTLEPGIRVSKEPLAMNGSDGVESIEGQVTGAKPGQRIVLYAQSAGVWWVQPFTAKPFTEIQSSSSWRNSTHLGTHYAALLVDSSYVPLPKTPVLPGKGGAISAISIVSGTKYVPKIVHFSGYDWEASQLPSVRGGKVNSYDPANAWTDADGFLHLRMVRRADQWVCADIELTRSLGEGLYQFTVRDVSHLDPAAVMTLYTWDGTHRSHREIDIEISRWGHSADKNAQYVVQPYYEPANVVRFEAPPGQLTFSFHWEPGEVSFRTRRGRLKDSGSASVSEHLFTSGVPAPGGELVHLNLYAFGNTRTPVQKEGEVIIEKFEYLP